MNDVHLTLNYMGRTVFLGHHLQNTTILIDLDIVRVNATAPPLTGVLMTMGFLEVPDIPYFKMS